MTWLTLGASAIAFSAAARNHANPVKQVSDLATKQLPALQEHLATAESLHK